MRTCSLLLLTACALPLAFGDTSEDALDQARRAYQKRDWKAALEHLGKAIAADSKNAAAYDLRGSTNFMLGRFKESVADFDRFLKLRPGEKPGHWRRGISLYYAGKFQEGMDQFKGYEKVDTNDVENAVWHFLCAARKDGIAKARAGMLKIGKDKRVPMMEVYDLFRGKITPADVLKAALADKVSDEMRSTRLFYAHLYLGLYYEATGDKKKARENMTLAGGKYRPNNHYMGEVARVHAELLNKK
jgi:lipoprotein NlpI